MSTMTRVRAEFLDLFTRVRYMFQMATYLGDVSSVAYNIPSEGEPPQVSLTAAGDPNAFVPNNEVLNVDRTIGFNTLLNKVQVDQLLGGNGNFPRNLMNAQFYRAMNLFDRSAYYQHLRAAAQPGVRSENLAAFDGRNVFNRGLAGAVTDAIFADAEASLVGDGTPRESFMHFFSPHAWGRARSLYSGSVRTDVQSSMLGVPFSAPTINGIPAMESNALPSILRVTAASSAIAGNVLTVTFPPGVVHPFQVGMPITTTGGTANVGPTAVAITAATATTISVPLTATDAATNGAVVVTCNAGISILVPLNKVFWAGEVVPNLEMVTVERTPGARALQVSALYGDRTIDGFARTILWPR
jgi:hypothetical protein